MKTGFIFPPLISRVFNYYLFEILLQKFDLSLDKTFNIWHDIDERVIINVSRFEFDLICEVKY